MKKTTVLIVGGVALAGAAYWYFTKMKPASDATAPAADGSASTGTQADVPKVVGPALTNMMNIIDKANQVVTTPAQASAVAAADTKNASNTAAPAITSPVFGKPSIKPIFSEAVPTKPTATTGTLFDKIKKRAEGLKGLSCYTMN